MSVVVDVVDEYLERVGSADELGAIDFVLGLLDEGMPAESLLLDVIAPAQRRVGELWAAGTWSVAREHGATAISERAVAAITTAVRPRPTRSRITVACTDGEYHALPTRLLAEVLRLRGWHVDFLGANVPGPHLITHLHQTGPDAVAIGCALPTRLPRAHATLTACQAVGIPVLAGGSGFGSDGRFAVKLGADGWAPTADAAADLLEEGRLPSFPTPGAILPHLADEEYTLFTRRRGEILAGVMAELPRRFPPMRDYTQAQIDHTADDLAHIADFLSAALYIDDTRLFTDFVTWTCDLLHARGVPSRSVALALRLLYDELHDFPRARHLLAEGTLAADGA